LWVYPRVRQICLYSTSWQNVLLPKQKDINQEYRISINRILNLEVAYASLCFESFSCLFLNISNKKWFLKQNRLSSGALARAGTQVAGL
jgi:hypothetical protein